MKIQKRVMNSFSRLVNLLASILEGFRDIDIVVNRLVKREMVFSRHVFNECRGASVDIEAVVRELENLFWRLFVEGVCVGIGMATVGSIGILVLSAVL